MILRNIVIDSQTFPPLDSTFMIRNFGTGIKESEETENFSGNSQKLAASPPFLHEVKENKRIEPDQNGLSFSEGGFLYMMAFIVRRLVCT